MIYPDVTLEAWEKKYPSITKPLQCHCGLYPPARPVVFKGYVGVETEPCTCGGSRMGRYQPVGKELDEWRDILGE